MSRRLLPALTLLLLLPVASAQTTVRNSYAPDITTPIRQVTFERVAALSGEEQQGIIKRLQQKDADWVTRQSPEDLSAFVQETVLGAYRDKGYWRAKVSAKITWVKGTGSQRQVDALITVISEGDAYWLKQIRWVGATVFPADELTTMMQIHPWDLVSRSKVADGLEAVRKVYASRGYIAFAAVPQMEFDDTAHNISLTITAQEDSPFRFGDLSVEGMDKASSRGLLQDWEEMREQLYSPENLRSFLERVLRRLPAGEDPLDYSSSSIDLDTHTVDISFSLLRTAKAEKTEQ